jgi:hypothetical protein
VENLPAVPGVIDRLEARPDRKLEEEAEAEAA